MSKSRVPGPESRVPNSADPEPGTRDPGRLRILYEDEALIFVDKPAGMVVQRGYDAEETVLLELVNEYLAGKGERAFLMQRLDRGTSGVIFFTKDAKLNRNVTRQFEKRNIRKTYVALCEGNLDQHQLIDAPLARIGPISFGVRTGGKRAVTNVTPLVANSNASLLKIELLTGRTHQIRAHLASISHPLVGDWLYGQRNAARPMLHAQSVALRHPRSGQMVEVASALPSDLIGEARQRGLTVIEDETTSPQAINYGE